MPKWLKSYETPKKVVTLKPKIHPFGRKANRFIIRPPVEDAQLNIIVGAVRSAKTWAIEAKLPALCAYQVEGQRIFTGVSKDTIYQNVLRDLFEIVGSSNYTYNRQTGELMLLGTDWRVIGAKDEGSEKYLRGSTVGIAIPDELVLMPEALFMMLQSRMSTDGSRLYATTNCDNPCHWLKVKVLDNKKLRHGLGKDVWTETWTMDDNPNLSEDYKERMKRSYTGVFYQRFIQGLWVLAEGSIYRDSFSEANMYDDSTRPPGLRTRGGHVDHFIGCDAGTANAQVYGDWYDDGETLWLDAEYYWDSRVENRQKTNSEYVSDLIYGCGEWPGFPKDENEWPPLICDPSAASFQAECRANNVIVIDADNEVVDGIRKVSSLLSQRKIKIHRRCRMHKQELETYAWVDPDKGKKGRDEPLKKHDHACDEVRYIVNTKIPAWRIAA